MKMLLPAKDDAAIMPENRESDEIRRRTAQLGGHILSRKMLYFITITTTIITMMI